MRNRRRLFNKKIDQQAHAWFDQTDDSKPFDAFGNSETKLRIGEDIFNGIQRNISRKRFTYFFYFKIAAVITVFFVIGIASYKIFRQNQENQNSIVWSQYKSSPGHFNKILLSDSSVVYLRPGSILKTPQEFKGKFREIQLVEGEAFFEIKHDKEHPFIVRSSNFKTQVLGTSFRIKNYHSLNNFQVSVATGKVAVMNGKTLLGFLTSTQELNFNTSNDKLLVATTDIDAEAWKTGEYSLKNASMKELVLALENIYGVKVLLKSPEIRNSAITIQFNMNDKIQTILNQLKLIHHLKYTIKNKEVILMK